MKILSFSFCNSFYSSGIIAQEDEIGGSATRSEANAAEPAGGEDDDDDVGSDDEDEKNPSSLKSSFGFQAISFCFTYFAIERLPFSAVASEPPQKVPAPSANMSPDFLKGQAAAAESSKKTPPDIKVSVVDQKTQAMQVAADNSKVTASATQELARAATFRLRQDSAEAMVNRLGDDIKEAKAELAELSDEDEKNAKRKEIQDLMLERADAKKRQKAIIEEGMQPIHAVPLTSSIAPSTAIPLPSPLMSEAPSTATALGFSSPV